MSIAVLVLGGLGLAGLWFGLYVIDAERQEREQLRRWLKHLDKPLQR